MSNLAEQCTQNKFGETPLDTSLDFNEWVAPEHLPFADNISEINQLLSLKPHESLLLNQAVALINIEAAYKKLTIPAKDETKTEAEAKADSDLAEYIKTKVSTRIAYDIASSLATYEHTIKDETGNDINVTYVAINERDEILKRLLPKEEAITADEDSTQTHKVNNDILFNRHAARLFEDNPLKVMGLMKIIERKLMNPERLKSIHRIFNTSDNAILATALGTDKYFYTLIADETLMDANKREGSLKILFEPIHRFLSHNAEIPQSIKDAQKRDMQKK